MQFITEVINEITASCSLPLFTKKKEIGRIVDRSLEWFYRNYEFALEECYMIIPSKVIHTKEFKETLTLKLPKDIEAVYDVKEVGGSNLLNVNNDPDLNIERRLLQDTFHTRAGYDLFYYVTSHLHLDTIKGLTLTSVKFYFNPNSKSFKIMGKKPNRDIVLSVYQRIKPEELFEDNLFFDYVVAKVKVQIARIMSTFEFDLIGGARLNVQEIRQEGQDAIRDIEEQIETSNNTDWFIMDV